MTVSKLLATEPTLPLEVRTWPNPTTGLLQLEGNLPTAEAVQIQVTTVLSTLVQSQTMLPSGGQVRRPVDVSTLPTGVYVLTVQQGELRTQFKVAKQ